MTKMRLNRIIELSVHELKTLEFIKGFFVDNDRIPGASEIAKNLSIKKSSAERYLTVLTEKQIIIDMRNGFHRWSRERYQAISKVQ